MGTVNDPKDFHAVLNGSIEDQHLLEIAHAFMIDQFDAAEIRSHLSCGIADFIFIAEHGYPRKSLSRGRAGSGDCARIFAFGKNNLA